MSFDFFDPQIPLTTPLGLLDTTYPAEVSIPYGLADPALTEDESDGWGVLSSGFYEPRDLEDPIEDYDREVRTWYGFQDGVWDDLTEQLEEWGRQLDEWVHSILGSNSNSEVIVTAPSGYNVGGDLRVVFHHDGSGLISLMDGNNFVFGLTPTTPDHAELALTITHYDIGGGVSTPRGGVEGSRSGGPSITFYFRRGN